MALLLERRVRRRDSTRRCLDAVIFAAAAGDVKKRVVIDRRAPGGTRR